jgi:hypothetical protein
VALISSLFIRQVPGVEETERFQRMLAGLHVADQRAWLKTRAQLAQTTQLKGLDFKPWAPRGAGLVFGAGEQEHAGAPAFRVADTALVRRGDRFAQGDGTWVAGETGVAWTPPLAARSPGASLGGAHCARVRQGRS